MRKEVSILCKRGLIKSKEGNNGGYSPGKPAQNITLADVYEAVMDRPVLGLAKNTPNPDCPIGKQINKNIDSLYARLDKTLLKKLSTISLADFSDKFD